MTTPGRGRRTSRTGAWSRAVGPTDLRRGRASGPLSGVVSMVVAALVAGLVAGLIAGLALVTTASAAAREPGDTAVTITAEAKKGVYFDAVEAYVEPAPDQITYTGTLTTVDDGLPVEGATITLDSRTPGASGWSTVADVVTDTSGRAEVDLEVVSNARLRYSYTDEGSTTTVSRGVRLKAMRDFNARLQETGKRAYLKGNINPGWNNRKVVWQRKTCKKCAWKQVDHKRSGATGAWKFRAGFPKKVGKSWFFRAKINGTDDYVTSVSGLLKTFVTQGRPVAGRVARPVARHVSGR